MWLVHMRIMPLPYFGRISGISQKNKVHLPDEKPAHHNLDKRSLLLAQLQDVYRLLSLSLTPDPHPSLVLAPGRMIQFCL